MLVRTVSLCVIFAFFANDLAFALETRASRSSLYTLSPPSNFAVLERNAEQKELITHFKDNVGVRYISRLIGSVLSGNGTRISERGLKKVIENHIKEVLTRDSRLISDFKSLDWKEVYKEDDTFCIPYKREGDPRRHILRYYLPDNKRSQEFHATSVPVGAGEVRVDLGDSFKKLPAPDMVDVVDVRGNPTGEVKTENEIHTDGKGSLHKSSVVIVFNSEGKLLRQKRAKRMRVNGDKYDVSAGGHAKPGESARGCAVRETEEKLGVRIHPDELISVKEENWFLADDDFSDSEMNSLYVYFLPRGTKVTPNKREVEEIDWVELDDLVKEHKSSEKKKYTRTLDAVCSWPGVMDEIKEIIRKRDEEKTDRKAAEEVKRDEERKVGEKFLTVVLAAGEGKRLKKHFSEPKPLIPIDGKPIIRHVLDICREISSKTILVVAAGDARIKTEIRQFVDKIVQSGQGTFSAAISPYASGALKKFPDQKNIVIIPGDALIRSKKAFIKALKAHERSQALYTHVTARMSKEFIHGLDRYVRTKDGKLYTIVTQKEIDLIKRRGRALELPDGTSLTGEELEGIQEVCTDIHIRNRWVYRAIGMLRRIIHKDFASSRDEKEIKEAWEDVDWKRIENRGKMWRFFIKVGIAKIYTVKEENAILNLNIAKHVRAARAQTKDGSEKAQETHFQNNMAHIGTPGTYTKEFRETSLEPFIFNENNTESEVVIYNGRYLRYPEEGYKKFEDCRKAKAVIREIRSLRGLNKRSSFLLKDVYVRLLDAENDKHRLIKVKTEEGVCDYVLAACTLETEQRIKPKKTIYLTKALFRDLSVKVLAKRIFIPSMEQLMWMDKGKEPAGNRDNFYHKFHDIFQGNVVREVRRHLIKNLIDKMSHRNRAIEIIKTFSRTNARGITSYSDLLKFAMEQKGLPREETELYLKIMLFYIKVEIAMWPLKTGLYILAALLSVSAPAASGGILVLATVLGPVIRVFTVLSHWISFRLKHKRGVPLLITLLTAPIPQGVGMVGVPAQILHRTGFKKTLSDIKYFRSIKAIAARLFEVITLSELNEAEKAELIKDRFYLADSIFRLQEEGKLKIVSTYYSFEKLLTLSSEYYGADNKNSGILIIDNAAKIKQIREDLKFALSDNKSKLKVFYFLDIKKFLKNKRRDSNYIKRLETPAKMLPDGSPYTIFTRLRDSFNGEFVSLETIRVTTKGRAKDKHLSKGTVERDLNTLYFLGLLEKKKPGTDIVYKASDLSPPQWTMVEPVLASLGARPGSEKRTQAKEMIAIALELKKEDIHKEKKNPINVDVFLLRLKGVLLGRGALFRAIEAGKVISFNVAKALKKRWEDRPLGKILKNNRSDLTVLSLMAFIEGIDETSEGYKEMLFKRLSQIVEESNGYPDEIQEMIVFEIEHNPEFRDVAEKAGFEIDDATKTLIKKNRPIANPPSTNTLKVMILPGLIPSAPVRIIATLCVLIYLLSPYIRYFWERITQLNFSRLQLADDPAIVAYTTMLNTADKDRGGTKRITLKIASEDKSATYRRLKRAENLINEGKGNECFEEIIKILQILVVNVQKDPNIYAIRQLVREYASSEYCLQEKAYRMDEILEGMKEYDKKTERTKRTLKPMVRRLIIAKKEKISAKRKKIKIDFGRGIGGDKAAINSLIRSGTMIEEAFSSIFKREDLKMEDIEKIRVTYFGAGGFKRVYRASIALKDRSYAFNFLIKVVKEDVVRSDSGNVYDLKYAKRLHAIANKAREKDFSLHVPTGGVYEYIEASGKERIVFTEAQLAKTTVNLPDEIKGRIIVAAYLRYWKAFDRRLFLEDPKPSNIVIRKSQETYMATVIDVDNVVFDREIMPHELVAAFLGFGFGCDDIALGVIDTLPREDAEGFIRKACGAMRLFRDKRGEDLRLFFDIVREEEAYRLPEIITGFERPNISITVNGKEIEISSGATLLDLMNDCSVGVKGTAIVYNRNRIKVGNDESKEGIAGSILLEDGDLVEFREEKRGSIVFGDHDITTKGKTLKAIFLPWLIPSAPVRIIATLCVLIYLLSPYIRYFWKRIPGFLLADIYGRGVLQYAPTGAFTKEKEKTKGNTLFFEGRHGRSGRNGWSGQNGRGSYSNLNWEDTKAILNDYKGSEELINVNKDNGIRILRNIIRKNERIEEDDIRILIENAKGGNMASAAFFLAMYREWVETVSSLLGISERRLKAATTVHLQNLSQYLSTFNMDRPFQPWLYKKLYFSLYDIYAVDGKLKKRTYYDVKKDGTEEEWEDLQALLRREIILNQTKGKIPNGRVLLSQDAKDAPVLQETLESNESISEAWYRFQRKARKNISSKFIDNKISKEKFDLGAVSDEELDVFLEGHPMIESVCDDRGFYLVGEILKEIEAWKHEEAFAVMMRGHQDISEIGINGLKDQVWSDLIHSSGAQKNVKTIMPEIEKAIKAVIARTKESSDNKGEKGISVNVEIEQSLGQGDQMPNDMSEAKKTNLINAIRKDDAFYGISYFIGKVLRCFNGKISARGMNKLVGEYISLNFPGAGKEKKNFRFNNGYKDGDSYCLPYRKKSERSWILRYSYEEDILTDKLFRINIFRNSWDSGEEVITILLASDSLANEKEIIGKDSIYNAIREEWLSPNGLWEDSKDREKRFMVNELARFLGKSPTRIVAKDFFVKVPQFGERGLGDFLGWEEDKFYCEEYDREVKKLKKRLKIQDNLIYCDDVVKKFLGGRLTWKWTTDAAKYYLMEYVAGSKGKTLGSLRRSDFNGDKKRKTKEMIGLLEWAKAEFSCKSLDEALFALKNYFGIEHVKIGKEEILGLFLSGRIDWGDTTLPAKRRMLIELADALGLEGGPGALKPKHFRMPIPQWGRKQLRYLLEHMQKQYKDVGLPGALQRLKEEAGIIDLTMPEARFKFITTDWGVTENILKEHTTYSTLPDNILDILKIKIENIFNKKKRKIIINKLAVNAQDGNRASYAVLWKLAKRSYDERIRRWADKKGVPEEKLKRGFNDIAGTLRYCIARFKAGENLSFLEYLNQTLYWRVYDAGVVLEALKEDKSDSTAPAGFVVPAVLYGADKIHLSDVAWMALLIYLATAVQNYFLKGILPYLKANAPSGIKETLILVGRKIHDDVRSLWNYVPTMLSIDTYGRGVLQYDPTIKHRYTSERADLNTFFRKKQEGVGAYERKQTEEEYTYEMLLEEGFKITLPEKTKISKHYGIPVVTAKVYRKDGSFQGGILLYIVEDCKTIIIDKCEPQFKKERKGRGRALLRHILSRPEYAEYKVIVRASSSFQKSFARMYEYQPVTEHINGSRAVADIIQKNVLNKITEPSQLISVGEAYRDKTFELLQDHCTLATLYGVVPRENKTKKTITNRNTAGAKKLISPSGDTSEFVNMIIPLALYGQEGITTVDIAFASLLVGLLIGLKNYFLKGILPYLRANAPSGIEEVLFLAGRKIYKDIQALWNKIPQLNFLEFQPFGGILQKHILKANKYDKEENLMMFKKGTIDTTESDDYDRLLLEYKNGDFDSYKVLIAKAKNILLRRLEHWSTKLNVPAEDLRRELAYNLEAVVNKCAENYRSNRFKVYLTIVIINDVRKELEKLGYTTRNGKRKVFPDKKDKLSSVTKEPETKQKEIKDKTGSSSIVFGKKDERPVAKKPAKNPTRKKSKGKSKATKQYQKTPNISRKDTAAKTGKPVVLVETRSKNLKMAKELQGDEAFTVLSPLLAQIIGCFDGKIGTKATKFLMKKHFEQHFPDIGLAKFKIDSLSKKGKTYYLSYLDQNKKEYTIGYDLFSCEQLGRSGKVIVSFSGEKTTKRYEISWNSRGFGEKYNIISPYSILRYLPKEGLLPRDSWDNVTDDELRFILEEIAEVVVATPATLKANPVRNTHIPAFNNRKFAGLIKLATRRYELPGKYSAALDLLKVALGIKLKMENVVDFLNSKDQLAHGDWNLIVNTPGAVYHLLELLVKAVNKKGVKNIDDLTIGHFNKGIPELNGKSIIGLAEWARRTLQEPKEGKALLRSSVAVERLKEYAKKTRRKESAGEINMIIPFISVMMRSYSRIDRIVAGLIVYFAAGIVPYLRANAPSSIREALELMFEKICFDLRDVYDMLSNFFNLIARFILPEPQIVTTNGMMMKSSDDHGGSSDEHGGRAETEEEVGVFQRWQKNKEGYRFWVDISKDDQREMVDIFITSINKHNADADRRARKKTILDVEEEDFNLAIMFTGAGDGKKRTFEDYLEYVRRYFLTNGERKYEETGDALSRKEAVYAIVNYHLSSDKAGQYDDPIEDAVEIDDQIGPDNVFDRFKDLKGGEPFWGMLSREAHREMVHIVIQSLNDKNKKEGKNDVAMEILNMKKKNYCRVLLDCGNGKMKSLDRFFVWAKSYLNPSGIRSGYRNVESMSDEETERAIKIYFLGEEAVLEHERRDKDSGAEKIIESTHNKFSIARDIQDEIKLVKYFMDDNRFLYLAKTICGLLARSGSTISSKAIKKSRKITKANNAPRKYLTDKIFAEVKILFLPCVRESDGRGILVRFFASRNEPAGSAARIIMSTPFKGIWMACEVIAEGVDIESVLSKKRTPQKTVESNNDFTIVSSGARTKIQKKPKKFDYLMLAHKAIPYVVYINKYDYDAHGGFTSTARYLEYKENHKAYLQLEFFANSLREIIEEILKENLGIKEVPLNKLNDEQREYIQVCKNMQYEHLEVLKKCVLDAPEEEGRRSFDEFLGINLFIGFMTKLKERGYYLDNIVAEESLQELLDALRGIERDFTKTPKKGGTKPPVSEEETKKAVPSEKYYMSSVSEDIEISFDRKAPLIYKRGNKKDTKINFLAEKNTYHYIKCVNDRGKQTAYLITYPDKKGRMNLIYGIKDCVALPERFSDVLAESKRKAGERINAVHLRSMSKKQLEKAHIVWIGAIYQEELTEDPVKPLEAYIETKKRLDQYGKIKASQFKAELINAGHKVGSLNTYYELYRHYFDLEFDLKKQFVKIAQKMPKKEALVILLNEAKEKGDNKKLTIANLRGMLKGFGVSFDEKKVQKQSAKESFKKPKKIFRVYENARSVIGVEDIVEILSTERMTGEKWGRASGKAVYRVLEIVSDFVDQDIEDLVPDDFRETPPELRGARIFGMIDRAKDVLGLDEPEDALEAIKTELDINGTQDFSLRADRRKKVLLKYYSEGFLGHLSDRTTFNLKQNITDDMELIRYFTKDVKVRSLIKFIARRIKNHGGRINLRRFRKMIHEAGANKVPEKCLTDAICEDAATLCLPCVRVSSGEGIILRVFMSRKNPVNSSSRVFLKTEYLDVWVACEVVEKKDTRPEARETVKSLATKGTKKQNANKEEQITKKNVFRILKGDDNFPWNTVARDKKLVIFMLEELAGYIDNRRVPELILYDLCYREVPQLEGNNFTGLVQWAYLNLDKEGKLLDRPLKKGVNPRAGVEKLFLYLGIKRERCNKENVINRLIEWDFFPWKEVVKNKELVLFMLGELAGYLKKDVEDLEMGGLRNKKIPQLKGKSFYNLTTWMYRKLDNKGRIVTAKTREEKKTKKIKQKKGMDRLFLYLGIERKGINETNAMDKLKKLNTFPWSKVTKNKKLLLFMLNELAGYLNIKIEELEVKHLRNRKIPQLEGSSFGGLLAWACLKLDKKGQVVSEPFKKPLKEPEACERLFLYLEVKTVRVATENIIVKLKESDRFRWSKYARDEALLFVLLKWLADYFGKNLVELETRHFREEITELNKKVYLPLVHWAVGRLDSEGRIKPKKDGEKVTEEEAVERLKRRALTLRTKTKTRTVNKKINVELEDEKIKFEKMEPLIFKKNTKYEFDFVPRNAVFRMMKCKDEQGNVVAYLVTYPDARGDRCVRYGMLLGVEGSLPEEFDSLLKESKLLSEGRVFKDKMLQPRASNQAHAMWGGALYQKHRLKNPDSPMGAFLETLEDVRQYGEVNRFKLLRELIGFGYDVYMVNKLYETYDLLEGEKIDPKTWCDDFAESQVKLEMIKNISEKISLKKKEGKDVLAEALYRLLIGFGHKKVKTFFKDYAIYVHWKTKGIDVATEYKSIGYDKTDIRDLSQRLEIIGVPENSYIQSVKYYLHRILDGLGKFAGDPDFQLKKKDVLRQVRMQDEGIGEEEIIKKLKKGEIVDWRKTSKAGKRLAIEEYAKAFGEDPLWISRTEYIKPIPGSVLFDKRGAGGITLWAEQYPGRGKNEDSITWLKKYLEMDKYTEEEESIIHVFATEDDFLDTAGDEEKYVLVKALGRATEKRMGNLHPVDFFEKIDLFGGKDLSFLLKEIMDENKEEYNNCDKATRELKKRLSIRDVTLYEDDAYKRYSDSKNVKLDNITKAGKYNICDTVSKAFGDDMLFITQNEYMFESPVSVLNGKTIGSMFNWAKRQSDRAENVSLVESLANHIGMDKYTNEEKAIFNVFKTEDDFLTSATEDEKYALLKALGRETKKGIRALYPDDFYTKVDVLGGKDLSGIYEEIKNKNIQEKSYYDKIILKFRKKFNITGKATSVDMDGVFDAFAQDLYDEVVTVIHRPKNNQIAADNDEILIGIDISKIPEIVMGLTGTRAFLDDIEEFFNSEGIKGKVTLRIDDDPERLAGKLRGKFTAKDSRIKLSNVIIIGAEDVINEGFFEDFYGTGEETGAFFAKVRFPEKMHEGTKYVFVNYVPLIKKALRKAFDSEQQRWVVLDVPEAEMVEFDVYGVRLGSMGEALIRA